jgi:ribosome-binding factor A
MSRRIERVNGVLRQEISRVLATELRDPRLSAMVTVTQVKTSADLRHAKVFVSMLGDGAEKRSTLEALRSAAGYVHRNIRQNLTMKSAPRVEFVIDDSIERGAELLRMIDGLPHPPSPETPPSQSSP